MRKILCIALLIAFSTITNDLNAATPTFTSFTPEDNSLFVASSTSLTMTFDQPVDYGSGSIQIYSSLDDSLVETIAIGGSVGFSTEHTLLIENPLSGAINYYIHIEEGTFVNALAEGNAAIEDETTWNFRVETEFDPTIISPTEGSRNNNIIEFEYEYVFIPQSNSITLSFVNDENQIDLVLFNPVQYGFDSTTLNTKDAESGVQSASQETIPDGVYTLILSHRNISGAVTLYNVIEDVEIDSVQPVVDTLSPVIGATDIEIDSDLLIEFDEAVGWETDYVYIRERATDRLHERIEVAGGSVSGSGTSELRINPTLDFEYGTEYYIEISDEAVRDLFGNYFVGINDTSWNFTTIEDPSPPRKKGGSVKRRVENLLKIGDTQKAEELKDEWSHLFDSSTQTTQTQLEESQVRDLELGIEGLDVKALQQLLNTQGFLVAETGVGSIGNETDYFGTLTQNALAKYQAANNIAPAVGYFGPITRAQMKSAGLVGLWW